MAELIKKLMITEPLVSVIIIFLNGEKYLGEAIQSVIDQAYNNWELLLVDDGSSDSSTEIARSYAKLRPDKIRYLEHEGHQNKGMSATRNLGISRANGDYIGFLDADDIWLPDKLAEQMAIFNQHPECGMVYGRTQIWHSWTGESKDKNKDHFYPLGVTANSVVYPPKIALLLLENKAQSPTTCNALFNRNVFDKAGFFLEDFKGMFEDAAFFCKVGLYVRTYVSDKVWAKYRQHNESCSVLSAVSNDDERARYKFLKWFEEYLNSKKIYLLKLRWALYLEFFPYRNKYFHKFFIHPLHRTKRFLKIKNKG